MFKEMAKGSAITGITGTTAVALLNKYCAFGRRGGRVLGGERGVDVRLTPRCPGRRRGPVQAAELAL